MYNQQESKRNNPAWAKRGFAGRGSSEPRGLVYQLASMGHKNALSALQQSNLPHRANWAKQATENYKKYLNPSLNKMRGTPSSAVRTAVPKLYL